MDCKELIAESWTYTQSKKKLIFWLGFFPCIFSTSFSIGYMAYQFFAFKKSFLFDNSPESFLHEFVIYLWQFIQNHLSWTWPLIILAIIYTLFYLLFPALARAAAIQMISRNKSGQNVGVGTGIRYGILSYLPLFEYRALVKTFSFFAVIIEMAFVLRNLGTDIFKILLPLFILVLILGFILTILFTYADLYIIIDGCSVFESIKKSAKLVIINWKYTFLITLLMLIIGVRIIIQAIIVFLFPIAILGISAYIASVAIPTAGIIVAFVLGFITLMLSAYLNGIVEIFSYTVWTFTFLELTSEKHLSARGTEEKLVDAY